VFLIARVLFDGKVALLSAVLYLMLPLELINSPIVKTEPLVILITCVSMYFLILFSQNSRPQWLVLAGIFAAMGFYVRQSALIIPVTVIGFLVLFHGWQLREILKSLVCFLVGYIFVLVIVVLYYSRFMRIDEILMSELSPLGFLIPHGKELLLLFNSPVETASRNSLQAFSLNYDLYSLYYKYVWQAFRLHSFLLIGLVFSLIVFCRKILDRNRNKFKEEIISHSILYLWLFSLSIAYTYFFYAQGFYIDYFREFLPPLVIIFSAFIVYNFAILKENFTLTICIVTGLFVSTIFFVVQSHYIKIPMSISFPTTIILMTFFYFRNHFESQKRRFVFMLMVTIIMLLILFADRYFFKSGLSNYIYKLSLIGIFVVTTWLLLEKRGRPKLVDTAKLGSLCAVLLACVFSITYSAVSLTLSYDSPWSPEALEKTSAYLKENTRNTDTIMSGAVIWELQALRRPYLNISHPLRMESVMAEDEKERLASAILTQPPEVIVLDGYTERTYFRQLPWLSDFLESRYEMVNSVGQAKYPVIVYKLKAV